MQTDKFPLWLQCFQTAFVAVMVPVYWINVGPENFLWFSDIALFATVFVLWTGNQLVASMAALSVVVLELVWNVDFFYHLATGTPFFNLAGYMFDASEKIEVRLLSGTFHIVLPWLLLYLVVTLGYDRRAPVAQTVVCWIVLPLSYVFTTPEQNVNWAHGFGPDAVAALPGVLQPLALMLAFPLIVYLPTHFLLTRVDRICKP